MADCVEITCPLCGEDDFDAPGFVNHIDRWCEKVDEAREAFADSQRKAWEIARKATEGE